MKIEAVTNRHGFSMLVASLEVFSNDVPAFEVRGLVDTGASVALLSRDLVQRLRPLRTTRMMTVHGMNGKTRRELMSFGARIGSFERGDCLGVAIDKSFGGCDMVIGLDILLHTGLTLTPGGEHRLAA